VLVEELGWANSTRKAVLCGIREEDRLDLESVWLGFESKRRTKRTAGQLLRRPSPLKLEVVWVGGSSRRGRFPLTSFSV